MVFVWVLYLFFVFVGMVFVVFKGLGFETLFWFCRSQNFKRGYIF